MTIADDSRAGFPYTAARELLLGAVPATIPGAVLSVRDARGSVSSLAAGVTALSGTGAPEAPVGTDTVFDLASLTKPLGVATVLACLVHRGVLSLDDRAGRFLPFLSGSPWQEVPLACLLAHSSGLPAWRPFAAELLAIHGPAIAGSGEARGAVARRIRDEAPIAACGAGAVYSDLGYILLGWILEAAAGDRLDRLFERFVAVPLGLRRTFFVPVDRGVPGGLLVRPDEVAATELCPTRGRILSGEVHDDNAWVLGGVAGHAGLFGTAGEVMSIIKALGDAAAGLASVFPGDVVRRFLTRDASPADSSRVMAFDTPSPSGSLAGELAPPGTVGHLGYTGTSFWFHPGCGAAIVLLTNRVHPSRDNESARLLRPDLHDLLWPILGCCRGRPGSS